MFAKYLIRAIFIDRNWFWRLWKQYALGWV